MLRNLFRFRYTVTAFACRTYSFSSRWRPLQTLKDVSASNFRKEAFAPCRPVLLKASFEKLPAVQKWFLSAQNDSAAAVLNHGYLSQFSHTIIPLEFTTLSTDSAEANLVKSFQRTEAPFQFFLEWTKLATVSTVERLYLAQASIVDLPESLKRDLPTPEIVAKAGTSDIYDANIWIGMPPTYTPLHRDPNPNLFVQLAGHKVVRILPPEEGEGVFAQVQASLGRSGSAAFRGEEMMKGEENRLLESRVWATMSPVGNAVGVGYEAQLGKGDAVFIPRGWWHSIKGVGEGVTGSVNWWFR